MSVQAADAKPSSKLTVEDMEAQAEANFQRQLALNMATERTTAKTNAEKTRHDAMMAVISNFKN